MAIYNAFVVARLGRFGALFGFKLFRQYSLNYCAIDFQLKRQA